ncbi:MAG: HAMP domain-containing histidine kinase [Archangium sp.]|nr:HAMP domain-containing histidine kinase [Archangium sp.]
MTLLSRVTRGAVLFAIAAALLAALATSVFTNVLVQREEDRRLRDAAVVLADELPTGKEDVAATVADELRETGHMALVFAVFEGTRHLGGDEHLPAPESDGCSNTGDLRACAVTAASGLRVVAAGPRAMTAWWLVLAAALSVLVATVLALVVSRPFARALVAPLTRLRGRLEHLHPGQQADLRAREGVEEIDSLRDALASLLQRLTTALGQAERFSANAAHELRTPLTAIRGQLELLGDDSGKLTGIRQTVTRLETLVERLLVLAMPPESAGPAELVSLRDAVEDVVHALPKPERVVLHLDDDSMVRADGPLVQAMLSNALQNALRFGTSATVTLRHSGPLATVLIEDDGPGIPLEERERVFEPFHRLSPGGHGLGLALIAHLARRYGGYARFLDAQRGARLELALRRET